MCLSWPLGTFSNLYASAEYIYQKYTYIISWVSSFYFIFCSTDSFISIQSSLVWDVLNALKDFDSHPQNTHRQTTDITTDRPVTSSHWRLVWKVESAAQDVLYGKYSHPVQIREKKPHLGSRLHPETIPQKWLRIRDCNTEINTFCVSGAFNDSQERVWIQSHSHFRDSYSQTAAIRGGNDG